MRRRIAKLALGAFVAGLIAIPAGTAVADGPGCQDRTSCVWQQDNYNGAKSVFTDSDQGDTLFVGVTEHSAKNRFLSRDLILKDGTDRVACLDPTENRPNPPGFNVVHVGAIGSHC